MNVSNRILNACVMLIAASACDPSAANGSNHGASDNAGTDAETSTVEPRDPAEWVTPSAEPGAGSICQPSAWEMTYADWAHVSDAIVVGTISRVEPVTDVIVEQHERDTIDACNPEATHLALDITLTDVEVLSGTQIGDRVTFRVGTLATGFWNSVPGARLGSTFYRPPGFTPPSLSSVPDGGIAWLKPSVGYVPPDIASEPPSSRVTISMASGPSISR
jgi:hypothetical protein